MAGLEDLVQLTDLITSVRGQSQTSTQQTSGGRTSRTTQRDISDEGIQELIRGILAGSGGVRDIGSSARSAGVYDSTTEDLLLGNLYSRAASQAELARAPTREETETEPTTTTTTTEMPGVGLGGLAGTLAATTAASSLMKGELPFGLGGGGEGGGISSAIGSLFGRGGSGAAGSAGNLMGNIAATPSLGVSGGVSGTAIGAAQNVAGGGGGGMLSRIPGGASGALSGAGGFLSGLSQEEEVLGNPTNVLSTLGPAMAFGGPMGAAMAGLGSILGSGLSGGSIQGTISNIPIVGDVLDPIIGGVRSLGRSIGKVFGW